jgi:hypothetical protein
MRPPILVLTGASNRFGGYLAELLRIEGLNWFDVQDVASLRPGAALPPLVLATASEMDDRTAAFLAAYVQRGGRLLAARPAPSLMQALGLPPAQPLPPAWSSGYVMLNPASPVVARLPWIENGVQYLGSAVALPSDRAEPLASPEALGWLAPYPGQPARYPAAIARAVGAGRVVLYAFDPAESAIHQQQGRPEQASTGAFPDFDGDGTFRPNDLFLGQLDPALRDVPQADLQRTLLLRAIEWLSQDRPLPRLWRFPDNAPAAALVDGDSDNMARDDLHLALETCDRYQAPFATLLKPEHIELVEPVEERQARQRGHRFGIHPWAGPQPGVDALRAVVEQDSAQFAARYNYRPRITRSHWVVWTGWVDHAHTLQGAGIQLDTNFTAGWGFKGGYVNGTGLPVRFAGEEGQVLDVFEQSTISGDDSWLLPKGGRPALTLADAIARSCEQIDAAVERYHTVVHPYFHPVLLKGGRAIPYPTLPWLETFLAHARHRHIPFLDAEQWLDWNQARRTVELVDLNYPDSGREMHCSLQASETLERMTLLVPLPADTADAALSLDGQPLNADTLGHALITTRHGRPYAALTCSLRAGDVRHLALRW